MRMGCVEIEGELIKPFETEKAYNFYDGKTEAWKPKPSTSSMSCATGAVFPGTGGGGTNVTSTYAGFGQVFGQRFGYSVTIIVGTVGGCTCPVRNPQPIFPICQPSIENAMTDQQRIDSLEKKVSALLSIVAALIDAQKYHLRGNLKTAVEKNSSAQRQAIKIVRE